MPPFGVRNVYPSVLRLVKRNAIRYKISMKAIEQKRPAKKTVAVRLEDTLMHDLDALAKRFDVTRSEVIVELLKRALKDGR